MSSMYAREHFRPIECQMNWFIFIASELCARISSLTEEEFPQLHEYQSMPLNVCCFNMRSGAFSFV